jgi:D-aminoacyl-tRNA deacylase
MLTLIFSKKNLFSNNILSNLISNNVLINEHPEDKYIFYDFSLGQNNNLCKAIVVNDFLYMTNEDVNYFESKFNTKCEFLIISSHKSETQKINIISIHVCGNFNKNELGGEERSFSYSYLDAFEFLYNKLIKAELPKDLIFNVEATHHGPSLERPVLYYEIGPNDDAYNNKDYQEYYIKLLFEFVNSSYKFKQNPIILIGAPHYLDILLIDSIKQKLKEKYNLDNILLSHIMPKYSMNDLLTLNDNELESIFNNLIKASQTNVIILNKDYMKSLTRLTTLLDKLENIKYYVI